MGWVGEAGLKLVTEGAVSIRWADPLEVTCTDCGKEQCVFLGEVTDELRVRLLGVGTARSLPRLALLGWLPVERAAITFGVEI